MERAASTGLNLFDPFSADSTPNDVDFDTIPDVLDDDNANTIFTYKSQVMMSSLQ